MITTFRSQHHFARLAGKSMEVPYREPPERRRRGVSGGLGGELHEGHLRRRLRLGGVWEERVAEADEGEQLRPGGGRAAYYPEQDLEEQAEPPRHRLPNRRPRMAPLLNRRHLRRRRHLSGGGAETSREDRTGRKQ